MRVTNFSLLTHTISHLNYTENNMVYRSVFIKLSQKSPETIKNGIKGDMLTCSKYSGKKKELWCDYTEISS